MPHGSQLKGQLMTVPLVSYEEVVRSICMQPVYAICITTDPRGLTDTQYQGMVMPCHANPCHAVPCYAVHCSASSGHAGYCYVRTTMALAVMLQHAVRSMAHRVMMPVEPYPFT